MLKDFSSFTFIELTQFFLGEREKTCRFFDANPKCDAEWYFVLGELCFLMAKDTEFSKFVDETIESLGPLRRACVITELGNCEKSLSYALISVKDDNARLRAASLRKIGECYTQRLLSELHAAIRDDSCLVRGTAIEQLVYFLVEKTEALEKLKSSISSEEDFVMSFFEDAIEEGEMHYSVLLEKANATADRP